MSEDRALLNEMNRKLGEISATVSGLAGDFREHKSDIKSELTVLQGRTGALENWKVKVMALAGIVAVAATILKEVALSVVHK